MSTQLPLDWTPAPAVTTPPPSCLPAVERIRLSRKALNILGRLQQGPASNAELARVGGARYGARIHELREAGHRIVIVSHDHATGLVTYRLEV